MNTNKFMSGNHYNQRKTGMYLCFVSLYDSNEYQEYQALFSSPLAMYNTETKNCTSIDPLITNLNVESDAYVQNNMYDNQATNKNEQVHDEEYKNDDLAHNGNDNTNENVHGCFCFYTGQIWAN